MFFFLCTLFLAPGVYAYGVVVDQHIKLQDGPGPHPGGEFMVYDWNSSDYLFNTFCLEKNEYFNYGVELVVDDISTEARAGGVGGGSPDPLDEKTAYLFHHFFWGTLQGYYYDSSNTGGVFGSRDASAGVLQEAIWYLENEITLGTPTNNYYVDLALNNGVGFGFGDVRVMNLTYLNGSAAQDQLTVQPVPEPTTMLLVGIGLIGLAGLGRKKFHHKRAK